MVDFNVQGKRTRTFNGFVQFQSPDSTNNNYYRLKERQGVSVTFNFLREQHYSDAGQKVVDPAGYAHTFNMRLKVTADLFDDTWSASDPANGDQAWQTLSYWIARSNANDPIEVVFVATMEALTGVTGTTDKFIHMKFVLDPNTFGPITYGVGGTNEISVSGDVLSIESIKRTTSSTPP
ncbi:hypothetical protein OAU44_00280 [bacterium]|jgi:hypothetical protein|nr:hypothetical protein [bacterium]